MRRIFTGKLHLRLHGFHRPAMRKRRPHKSGRLLAFGVRRRRWLTAIPLMLAAIVLLAWLRMPAKTVAHFYPVDSTQVNPLMGWAVDAQILPENVQIDHSLVYAMVTWRELEPQEDVFDFEAFEERIHLDQWRALGKKLVLRFAMDVPGEAEHRDIPDWLYEQLYEQLGEHAGTVYQTEEGAGFSPDYSSLWLLKRHGKVIARLGERYDADDTLAFVEIGSLGHNGEWRIAQGTGRLPLPNDATQYINHYAAAFSNTTLLTKNPYRQTRALGLGVYNPVLGDTRRTWKWLDMLSYGGYDDDLEVDLEAIPAYGIGAPAGGSLLSDFDMDGLEQQMEACRLTYASGVKAYGLDPSQRDMLSEALEHMGYRLWVREAKYNSSIREGYRLKVELSWRNDGVAPMSRSWPVELSLLRDGKVAYAQRVEVDTHMLTPGEQRVAASIDIPVGAQGVYQLALAILDPHTGEPAVELPMSAQRVGLRFVLGEVEVFR